MNEPDQPSLLADDVVSKLEYDGIVALMNQKTKKNEDLEAEVERLLEIIRELKREKFGPKPERYESPEQYCLFNEAEVLAKASVGEESEEQVKVDGFTRKRGKRKPLPENLPREVVVIDLPEGEKVADDGTALRVIGKDISEKLVYEPPTIKVIQYHRLRYGVDSGDTGKTAPPIPSIIPKGIVTPSLLAAIITSKYVDGLPLYRQEAMFARLDIDLPRNSMARWVVQGAQACQPIKNLLEERLMESRYVSCDETYTQVLKEKGRKASQNSYMWARATPTDEKKIVLFDYDPHRSGEVAKRLLGSYIGTLQCDGYAAYNILEKQAGLVRIGCNMHGRRGFYAAWKTGAKAGQPLAAEGLKFYKQIYDLEEKFKGLSFEERHEQRLKKASPIWEEFKIWSEKSRSKTPPQSKVGEALRYFVNEYDNLIGYLKAGYLEPDNGFIERAIKNFAIGRNNWLFSDTEDGAEASSLFYSLAVTIRINGGNPYSTLRDLFTELPKAKTLDDYEQLVNLVLSPHQIG